MKKGKIIAIVVVSLVIVGGIVNSLSDKKTATVETNSVQTDTKKETSKGENKETPKFKEQVLVDNKDTVIKLTGVENDGFMMYKLNLYIENKNDKIAQCIQARDVSVNGFMIEPICSVDVQPQKKVNDSLSFMLDDLKKNNIDITKPINIELKLHVFFGDDFMSGKDTDVIKIKLS